MFDGKAYGEGIVELVKGYVEREVAPLKAENAELKARIAELEARPMPEAIKGDPGESVDHELVMETISDEVAKAVAAMPVPKDGKDAAGIVEALKDSGELVLTLSDGRLIRTGIRDGEKGADGRDGFGFEDLDFEYDGERSMALTFTKADEFKTFRFDVPMMIDRGVYKAGENYARGDAVTWGGSLWTAQKETGAKPDTADSGWRLAVKKGRDGKDAKNG